MINNVVGIKTESIDENCGTPFDKINIIVFISNFLSYACILFNCQDLECHEELKFFSFILSLL